MTLEHNFTDSQRNLNLGNVLTLGFGFFILFTGYTGCQNITAKIMKDLGFQGLGFINLAVVYLSFGVGSLFASRINKALGTKLTLCFSGLAHALWIASFLMPAYKFEAVGQDKEKFSDGLIVITNIGGAFLLGLGAGPLWVSQSFYISLCANDANKGRYNSIFFSIFQGASLVTYPVAGIMIKNFKKSTFYWLMTLIALIGSLFFLVLSTPQKSHDLTKVLDIELVTPEGPGSPKKIPESAEKTPGSPDKETPLSQELESPTKLFK
jgi:hypothetical protein